MGFKNPIGQIVTDYGKTFHVIGVVKDFVLTSPFDPVAPMVIEGMNTTTGLNVINLKIAQGTSISG